jgi:hypothetical protein
MYPAQYRAVFQDRKNKRNLFCRFPSLPHINALNVMYTVLNFNFTTRNKIISRGVYKQIKQDTNPVCEVIILQHSSRQLRTPWCTFFVVTTC